jgi:hypothetical protein
MRLSRLVSTLAGASVLSLALGATGLLYAQEQHEDAKPEEARPEASKPAQDDAKTPRQEEAKPQKENQDKDKDKDQAEKRDNAKADSKSNDRQARTTASQGGGRIPDDKFRAHFGRQHTFVINHPTVVNGQSQFQYGGYSFTFVDAWPAGWAYTDQCYVDYINGEYFLFDLLHPGVQLALVVVM